MKPKTRRKLVASGSSEVSVLLVWVDNTHWWCGGAPLVYTWL